VDHRTEGHDCAPTAPTRVYMLGHLQPAGPLPGALDITHIQDGVGVARAQAQALIGSIIHLHVASATRGAHEEPVQAE
jgi:hypothetical protein